MMLRRSSLVAAATIIFAALALTVVNAIDYFRFHGALARMSNLTETEIMTIADYCQSVKNGVRFTASDAPAAFQPLHPLNGSLFRGSCDALLYELGEVYLWARVSSSLGNQQMLYFTNSNGPQKTKVIWNRNPEFVRLVSPTGRLMTVTQWTMHDSRQWIVLPATICVIDSAGAVGAEEKVGGRRGVTTNACESHITTVGGNRRQNTGGVALHAR